MTAEKYSDQRLAELLGLCWHDESDCRYDEYGKLNMFCPMCRDQSRPNAYYGTSYDAIAAAERMLTKEELWDYAGGFGLIDGNPIIASTPAEHRNAMIDVLEKTRGRK